MDKKATINIIKSVSQVNDSKQYLLDSIKVFTSLGSRYYNFNLDLQLKDKITPEDIERKKNMLRDIQAQKFNLYVAKKKFDVEYVPVSTLYN